MTGIVGLLVWLQVLSIVERGSGATESMMKSWCIEEGDE